MTADHAATANKVAAVTVAFWVMKICATTVGETGGDMLSMTMNVGYAASSLILIGIFAVALTAQLAASRFHPFLYWTVVLATSTAGTTISDFMDRTLELGYATGSAILVSLLVLVLIVWRLTTGSLSVNRITDRTSEIFYWSAILVSNTLGTAVGDFLADSSGLGFLYSNLIITGALALIVLCYVTTTISRTALFWAAFVLTRPFGATMGDLLTRRRIKAASISARSGPRPSCSASSSSSSSRPRAPDPPPHEAVPSARNLLGCAGRAPPRDARGGHVHENGTADRRYPDLPLGRALGLPGHGLDHVAQDQLHAPGHEVDLYRLGHRGRRPDRHLLFAPPLTC
ncbi:hypothetical protein sos41_33450 [Alphaproteobacteria bacterium SO-S41]|nr:hypothetical protein sos41_33450 [Alphaproteobacteria bacterium SO-S41]